MPTYEFLTEGGRVIEAFYPMADAPSIGKTVRIDGQKATRIIRASRLYGFARKDQEFMSVQVHPKHPAIKKRDARGRAVFASNREAERFCERSRKLAETVDPSIPSYEFGQMSSMERCDADGANAEIMKRTRLMRDTAEVLRGVGALDIDDYLEGE